MNTRLADPHLWWVVVEDGRLFIHLPTGERLYGEVFCEITDHANETPKAIFKAAVNIAASVEEMNKAIAERNKK